MLIPGQREGHEVSKRTLRQKGGHFLVHGASCRWVRARLTWERGKLQTLTQQVWAAA